LVIVSSTQQLPADTEARLAGFTELAAAAMASTQARVELRGFAEEQAALGGWRHWLPAGRRQRRLLAAVTVEAGQLLGGQHAVMSRYGPHGATVVAAWSSTRIVFPVGTRWIIGGRNLHTMVSGRR
jgi:hypothetical protein